MYNFRIQNLFSVHSGKIDNLNFLIGSGFVQQNRLLSSINRLSDVELSVFSQWGEDGIIDWLVEQNPLIPETFVEFGVENYTESNTRFLLKNRNWRGLVIDGGKKNIDYVKKDSIYWKHSLTAVESFITVANINDIILKCDLKDQIGILSVDIDGNDYWVWEAINCISPHIVIAEYNSAFGNLNPLSIPYSPQFVRSTEHYSYLYYGASIKALTYLATQKGYTLLGSNSAGSNAFFVRNDIANLYTERILNKECFPSKFRESRDKNGHLSFKSGISRSSLIGDMPVVNVETGRVCHLNEFSNLYSQEWALRL